MWVIDTECYPNFFLICALNILTNDKKDWEIIEGNVRNDESFLNFFKTEKTIGFNSIKYDLPMINAASVYPICLKLKNISDDLILTQSPHWEVLKKHNVFRNVIDQDNHIDLIEVAPGKASLKLYGGRLNAKKLQDLPFDPAKELNDQERIIVKQYCYNDLQLTKCLFDNLSPQLKLRKNMSDEYKLNLRSKSDAQIAEVVIKAKVEELSNHKIYKRQLSQTFIRYDIPSIISFKTDILKDLLMDIEKLEFLISDTGSVVLPERLSKESIKIGDMNYKLGIGGLHSMEKKRTVYNDLYDFDVASYYPSIIYNQKLAPDNMGNYFTNVYKDIIATRLSAKSSGDKILSDVLKIVLNGSFGKFGSKYSYLYSPKLLIQTTITGQLLLLMLIEAFEMASIPVLSANTDGIVVNCPIDRVDEMMSIAGLWQTKTSLILEKTDYKLLASRDVNNYVAITTDGKIKLKGCFSDTNLAKNPANQIVYDSVIKLLSDNIPIEYTIRNTTDIRKFVTVRTVKGGALWQEEYLGKVVRFYKSSQVSNDLYIRYSTNGNKVPKSNGVRPCMELPDAFPTDIDYDYYIDEANKLLKDLGYGRT